MVSERLSEATKAAASPGVRRALRSIRLDPLGEGTLQVKLYRTIRSLIARGVLVSGARLPSSRVLSLDLGISRNTVTATLDQLAADGWVSARRGSGVFVSAVGPSQGEVPGDRPAPTDAPEILPFDVGPPGLDIFPLDAWRRVQARRWSTMSRASLREGHSAGFSELRKSIADHMWIARGVPCSPDQVIVTHSVEGGIDLVIRALTKPGDEVWIENPGYFGSRFQLGAAGLQLAMIPVDGEGLDVAAGERVAPAARFALVTPQCQFPTCVSLSPQRRADLLAWAHRAGSWIVEDDYDAEFRFDQSLPTPLIAQAGGDRVIYANSFNKVLFPALRVGYLIVPPDLADTFARVRRYVDGHPAVPNQMVLRDFIEEGWLDTHMRNCRAAYEERRAVMFDRVEPRLAPWFRFERHAAGLHIVAELDRRLDPVKLQTLARANGIELTPMAMFLADEAPDTRLLLGFAGYPPAQLIRAADRLAALLEREAPTTLST